MIDIRKAIRKAMEEMYNVDFRGWLTLCNSLIKKDKSGDWKVPSDIRKFLYNDDVELKTMECQDFLAIKAKHSMTSNFMPISEITNDDNLVLKRVRNVIPDYCMDICTSKRKSFDCDEVIIILAKYPDGYHLENITDRNEFEYYNSRKYKSRSFIDNYEISKNRAIELGFKFVKIEG